MHILLPTKVTRLVMQKKRDSFMIIMTIMEMNMWTVLFPYSNKQKSFV